MTRKKTLSSWSLVMINIIAIDNIRSLPFSASYGYGLIGFYILGVLLFLLPIGMMTSELATHLPKKGGIYIWIREAFGIKIAFFTIWIQWFYNIIWYPTILAFSVKTILWLYPSIPSTPIIVTTMVIVLFLFATLINVFGMRLSSLISNLGALLGTLVPMIILIALGIYYQYHFPDQHIHWDHGKHLIPHLSTHDQWLFLTAIIFGLIGIEMSAAHADEVENPSQAYPKALLISCAIIFVTLVASSLAIAWVIPIKQLNVITGLGQGLAVLLKTFHLESWLWVLMSLILIGCFVSVSAWIIGPIKGMLIAAQDGCLPKCLKHENKHGIPTRLLMLQVVFFLPFCGIYLLMPSVQIGYITLTAMMTQLAVLIYIIMIGACIKLRKERTSIIPTAFTIPGGMPMLIILATTGISICLITIALGFIPPTGALITMPKYIMYMSLTLIVVCIIPFICYHYAHKHKHERQVKTCLS